MQVAVGVVTELIDTLMLANGVRVVEIGVAVGVDRRATGRGEQHAHTIKAKEMFRDAGVVAIRQQHASRDRRGCLAVP